MSEWVTGNTVTVLVLVGLFVAAMAYDLVVAMRHGWDATISQTVWRLVRRAPIVAFLVGVVCGHLFWPQQKDVAEEEKPTRQGEKSARAACNRP